MKGWAIPAPAPWANTKHALAPAGAVKSPETVPALPVSIVSFSELSVFIAPEVTQIHAKLEAVD
jgi:hypothetical protein